ncbi:MAG: DnaA/Hda family protein [Deltaproteobacteria bacterium]|nr:DnaA/Hda family protein [Deltaproteobacteria bacterium]
MKADWTRVKEVLSERIDAREFQTWIEPLTVDNSDDGHLALTAPNKFVQDWFNKHYADFVRDVFFELTESKVRVNVGVMERPKPTQLDFGAGFLPVERAESERGRKKKQSPRTHFISKDHGLNPRYNFARFVVGASNQFAYAASLSVAKNPARRSTHFFSTDGRASAKRISSTRSAITSSPPPRRRD